MGATPSQADAPGSMILMGEYAVLEGSKAVLMTLRHRLGVVLTPTQKMHIFSDRFGEYLEGQSPVPSHAALCKNILEGFFQDRPSLQQPFRIDIKSSIPPTYGFGSSAALAAALLKALYRAYGLAEDFRGMFSTGHKAILATHGRGSGADLAAALADLPFLVFDPVAQSVTAFQMPFAVQAIYTGYKTATPEVLKIVAANTPPAAFKNITQKMGNYVDAFLLTRDFGAIEGYQECMDALGVTCPQCKNCINIFKKHGVISKISGSGLGDCVVGFSQEPRYIEVVSPFEFLSAESLSPCQKN